MIIKLLSSQRSNTVFSVQRQWQFFVSSVSHLERREGRGVCEWLSPQHWQLLVVQVRCFSSRKENLKGAYKLTSVWTQYLVTGNTPQMFSYMQQHSLYFLNAKCPQSSYIKDHCQFQVWRSSPYTDTYLFTYWPTFLVRTRLLKSVRAERIPPIHD